MEGANTSGWPDAWEEGWPPDAWQNTSNGVVDASPNWQPATQDGTTSGWSTDDYLYGMARWDADLADAPPPRLDENGLLPLVEGPDLFAAFSPDALHPHPLSPQEIAHEVAADPQQFYDFALFQNGCARRRAARGLPRARCSLASPCRRCLLHPNAPSRLAYRNISSLADVHDIHLQSQQRELARQAEEHERNRAGPSASEPIALPHLARLPSRSPSPRVHSPTPPE